jgi:hypothetical protein
MQQQQQQQLELQAAFLKQQQELQQQHLLQLQALQKRLNLPQDPSAFLVSNPIPLVPPPSVDRLHATPSTAQDPSLSWTAPWAPSWTPTSTAPPNPFSSQPASLADITVPSLAIPDFLTLPSVRVVGICVSEIFPCFVTGLDFRAMPMFGLRTTPTYLETSFIQLNQLFLRSGITPTEGSSFSLLFHFGMLPC